MNKKILILTNDIYGLICFRKEVVENIIKNNIVSIAIPVDQRMDELQRLGINLIATKNLCKRGTNPLTDIKLLREYLKIIKQTKPDIILTYTIKPNIYGGLAARLKKIPTIVNITGLGTAVENPGWLQKVTVNLYKLAMKPAKRIFFQNSSNEAFFSKFKIKNNVHKLIPGSGVNLEHHSLQPYPDNDNPIKFLFMSRVMKEKGIEEFLEAAKYIKQNNAIKTEFHIIGACEEDYKETLEKLQKEGIIYYHGRQNDVRRFIKNCHCLIHPSFYPEGMSNVILENAAAGRPVITTNRPGCREAINDGETGYIIEPKNINDLIITIEKFIRLSNEEKKQMGLKGRSKMEKEFNRNIVVQAYLEAIKNL